MQRSTTSRRAGVLGALLVSAILALTGCTAGSTGTPGSATDKTKLTVALTGEPVNLDFTTTAGAAIPQAMMSNVYEGLVTVDQTGAIKPLLATGWETSGDNKSYTFTLQKGVKFSNGADFDAEDVKFSIERVKSDAWLNGLKSKMDVVDNVQVVSPETVTVNLKRPSQAWLYSMTTLVGAMFDPSGVDDLANKPVGTGPYALESWARGESIKLAGRDDYWGVTAGHQERDAALLRRRHRHHQRPDQRGRRPGLQHAGPGTARRVPVASPGSRSSRAPATARSCSP